MIVAEVDEYPGRVVRDQGLHVLGVREVDLAEDLRDLLAGGVQIGGESLEDLHPGSACRKGIGCGDSGHHGEGVVRCMTRSL